jgi:hypothetical protein
MSNEPPPKDKIIVAVRGVVDQVLSETVQKVINRLKAHI